MNDWLRAILGTDILTRTIIVFILVFGSVMFFRAIYKYFVARKAFKGLPAELERDHIVIKRNDKPLVYRGKKVISIDPYDLIDEKEYRNVTPLFVPAILTGLGILGTFWGVTNALVGFPPELFDNPKDMLAYMPGLIKAMQTAFFTSLFGIGGATGFVFLEKMFVSDIQKKCNSALDLIKKNYVVESATIYLREQMGQDSSRRMAEAAIALKETVEGMNSASAPEKIAQLIKDGLDSSIEKHLKTPMENIAERLLVLDDVREASISMKESNATLTKFMTEDLQGIFGGLKESLGSAQQAMSETNSALEKTNQNLNQQKENLDSFLDEMKNVLLSQRQTFEEVSGKIKTGFEEASGKVFEQYQMFNRDMSEMGTQVKELSQQFIEIINTGRETFQEEVAEFEKMLDSQRGMAREAFDDIRRLNQQSIQDIVDVTKTTLIDAVGQTRDSAIGLIDSTRDNFEKVVNETNQKLQDTLNGVGDELVKTSDRVQTELKVFREEYTQALSGFFDQQKTVLEKVLGDNVTALSGLVGDLREAFESEYTQKKDLMDRLQAAIAS